jgi:UDP-glucose 4-epimerase
MTVLVTGSAGRLGGALVLALRSAGHAVRGIDLAASPLTDATGSITDRAFVKRCMAGTATVLHTATLHKPQIETHGRQAFIDVNVTGTLNLLEEAAAAGVGAFVFTSSTSTYGHAMQPAPGAPAVWVDEDLRPLPKNIYGISKLAAEDLCALMHRLTALPCVVLRTSRFFPADGATLLTELLHRRIALEDAVSAHLRAAERAAALGFGRYVVSATSPFTRDDLPGLQHDAAAVIRRRCPGAEAFFDAAGWALPTTLDRVYVNQRARHDLGWAPLHSFDSALTALRSRPPDPGR